MEHRPVMYREVLAWFTGYRDGVLIDATLGSGGHSEGILSQLPESVKVLGIDRDPDAVAAASRRLARFGARFRAVCASYADADTWRSMLPSGPVRGILMDLGLSSTQLAEEGRGFSFSDHRSLDMRFNPRNGSRSAADLVNTLPAEELARIFFRFGEERLSRRIAAVIVQRRREVPFTSAADLARVIAGAVPGRHHRIHPATRCFQALRIAVNRELDHLEAGLEQAERLLAPGGRLVVISFHSLEDRIVKQFLRHRSGVCSCPPEFPECRCGAVTNFKILTRRPQRPESDEIRVNPRARSARLRCAERVFSVEKGEVAA